MGTNDLPKEQVLMTPAFRGPWCSPLLEPLDLFFPPSLFLPGTLFSGAELHKSVAAIILSQGRGKEGSQHRPSISLKPNQFKIKTIYQNELDFHILLFAFLPPAP